MNRKFTVAAVATVLVVLSAAPAAASQPTATLQPGQDQLYSTAFWGETSFCARNDARSAGQMHVVNRFGTGDGPFVDVPARSTQCFSGWYVGVPAKVVNTGRTALAVTVTP